MLSWSLRGGAIGRWQALATFRVGSVVYRLDERLGRRPVLGSREFPEIVPQRLQGVGTMVGRQKKRLGVMPFGW